MFQRFVRCAGHEAGSLNEVTTPSRFGPRHCGQSWPTASGVTARTTTRATRHIRQYCQRFCNMLLSYGGNARPDAKEPGGDIPRARITSVESMITAMSMPPANSDIANHRFGRRQIAYRYADKSSCHTVRSPVVPLCQAAHRSACLPHE